MNSRMYLVALSLLMGAGLIVETAAAQQVVITAGKGSSAHDEIPDPMEAGAGVRWMFSSMLGLELGYGVHWGSRRTQTICYHSFPCDQRPATRSAVGHGADFSGIIAPVLSPVHVELAAGITRWQFRSEFATLDGEHTSRDACSARLGSRLAIAVGPPSGWAPILPRMSFEQRSQDLCEPRSGSLFGERLLRSVQVSLSYEFR